MENASPEAAAYQVAFENDYVRIVRVTLGAGQKPPVYRPAAPAMVRVDLNPESDGAAPGRVQYAGAPPPDLQGYPAPAPVSEFRVELKAPPPPAAPLALDAVRVDPARYRVVLENDRVRVVRLGFGPGERGLMVSHPPRVLITLTDVAVKLLFADGRSDQRGGPAGIAGWLETETLQTENAAADPLEVVLVEPKGPAAS
jgi:hypothetical protein